MKYKFDFEEVNLIPRRCIVDSRGDCDTSITYGGFKFKIPIVPANMTSIINRDLAVKLASGGYFYIMHRFDINQVEFIETMKNLGLVSSISIGVNDDSYQLINELIELDLVPDFITIDVAHGHSNKMQRMLGFIKSRGVSSFIISGNVSTQEGVIDLDEWGADSIKVGIGPGMSCTTWPTTGFGSRNCQASTIMDCSSVTEKPIIADGGIRVPGDIAKSIVLGVDMVMIGGMLGGFSDSPGSVVFTNGFPQKEFWGSSSQYQSGKKSRIEGKKILIDYKDMTLLEELLYLEECLQSSISYGGGSNIESLKGVNFLV
jgi:GMP reductase